VNSAAAQVEPERPKRSDRPFVHVNCAMSVDGRLAYANGTRARLSGPEDIARVQRLRADSDAVLVGVGTVLRDDPALRVHWDLLGQPAGRSPFRIVLDSTGRTPDNARFLDGSQPTLVITREDCAREFPPHVETVRAGRETVDLHGLLRYLQGRGVQRVMVEGGATVIASFFRAALVDRLTVYMAPVLIGGHTAPPLLLGPETNGPHEAIGLRRVDSVPLGEGLLLTFEPRSAGGSDASSSA
jgi:2,5-diamino-6-(ribosylamino)-4(3H)-pyrimidinone 5'-phosphate reductase